MAQRKPMLDFISEGITVRVVKLIESLAVDAILSGRKRIDLESLALLHFATSTTVHGLRCGIERLRGKRPTIA